MLIEKKNASYFYNCGDKNKYKTVQIHTKTTTFYEETLQDLR